VKSNPYGVFPVARMVAGPLARPSSPTVYALMLSVPRSVTTRVRPLLLKATWAGSASSALSGRTESGMATSRSCSIRKPAMFGVPLLST
jgi:hypothetical protein